MASPDAVKPTILALHGSGSNATIHTVQLARLGRLLKPHFEIESLEAPFPSAAGPGVLPFFEGCGPYKRWVPPTEKHSISSIKAGEASGALPPEVSSLLQSTVAAVHARGSRVAGLIGFSQGTRVVAGLLKGMEVVRALKSEGADVAALEGWLDFSFALSVCGSYPPPLVPEEVGEAVEKAGWSEDRVKEVVKGRIGVPVLHVQGRTDEWAWAGKLLLEHCYEVEEGKSEVMEAEMGHHYPTRAEETERMKDWVLEVWGRTGGKA